MTRLALLCASAALLGLAARNADAIEDRDHDHLDDDFEQALLVKFTPTFLISSTECDTLPAEFQPGLADPKPIARNGVVYGQVFSVEPAGLSGVFVEVRYYHLWNNDCGRVGHFLDAEYVSVLVRANRGDDPPGAWKALYWFAAAHQGTVCEASNGASAASLYAENQGAAVWVSGGKHASYLSYKLCTLGCGGDRWEPGSSWTPSRVINLGERGAPLNGAVWVESRQWTVADKMQRSEFSRDVLAQLAASSDEGAVRLSLVVDPAKAVILAGEASLDALAAGNRHTGSALNEAGEHADSALDTGAASVGRSLRRAQRVLGEWFKDKR